MNTTYIKIKQENGRIIMVKTSKIILVEEFEDCLCIKLEGGHEVCVKEDWGKLGSLLTTHDLIHSTILQGI